MTIKMTIKKIITLLFCLPLLSLYGMGSAGMRPLGRQLARFYYGPAKNALPSPRRVAIKNNIAFMKGQEQLLKEQQLLKQQIEVANNNIAWGQFDRKWAIKDRADFNSQTLEEMDRRAQERERYEERKKQWEKEREQARAGHDKAVQDLKRWLQLRLMLDTLKAAGLAAAASAGIIAGENLLYGADDDNPTEKKH